MSETQQPVEEMETAALQAEYGGVNLDAMEKDNDLRKRQIAIWKELVDREIVEFPKCPRCNYQTWHWGYDGVPECGSCEFIPTDAVIEEIEEAAQTLLNGDVE